VYCCGGAEEPKGGDGKEETDGDAAAASPNAVAPVGVQNVAAAGLCGVWRDQVLGFTLIIARAVLQDRGREHELALEFHPNKSPDYCEAE
jgi:hypothetical protein